MRIAMISMHSCPLVSLEGGEAGGINIYLLELGKELTKKGIKVDIFTRLQDIKQKKVVDINPNLRVIHLTAGVKKHILVKKLMPYVKDFSINIEKFIETEKVNYDLIHSHYYLSGLAGIELTKKYKKPHIITFHTLGLMKNLVARNDSEREEELRIASEKLLIQKSNLIVATSESDKKYLIYLYGAKDDKVKVITPGVNTNLFRPVNKISAKSVINAEPNHRIIMFVGRIEPLKGIDVLIYALKIVLSGNKQLKNVCLWIVGGDSSSEERKRLEKLKVDLGLETSVKFIGQRNHNELPYYFNSAELVVIPSHYESFGMSSLESMACGTPVITTNVSGISGILDQKFRELITSSNNPIMLANQIEHLLIDKAEYERISKGVLQQVKDFSWQNVAEKVENLYKIIILE